MLHAIMKGILFSERHKVYLIILIKRKDKVNENTFYSYNLNNTAGFILYIKLEKHSPVAQDNQETVLQFGWQSHIYRMKSGE